MCKDSGKKWIIFLQCPLPLSLWWRVLEVVGVYLVIPSCCKHLLGVEIGDFGSTEKRGARDALEEWWLQSFSLSGLKGIQESFRRRLMIINSIWEKVWFRASTPFKGVPIFSTCNFWEPFVCQRDLGLICFVGGLLVLPFCTLHFYSGIFICQLKKRKRRWKTVCLHIIVDLLKEPEVWKRLDTGVLDWSLGLNVDCLSVPKVNRC